jgi:hypothetical protein
MAIQHLTSSTANKRPTPAVMSNAQLAINSNTSSPGLFFKDSAGALIKVGPVHVGSTAPNASPASGGETGNTVGEQWLDTTGGTYVFKVWDGSAWRSETGTFVDVNGDVMTGALGIIAGSAGSPGLYFSGDTNTGLYSPGADQVAISTNGTGRLFVDASGNVGVGTASPVDTLHVVGAARFGDGTNFAGVSASASGAAFEAAAGSANVLFRTGGTERARIDSSGRLLVGTSNSSGAPSSGATIQLADQFSLRAVSGGGVTNARAFTASATTLACIIDVPISSNIYGSFIGSLYVCQQLADSSKSFLAEYRVKIYEAGSSAVFTLVDSVDDSSPNNAALSFAYSRDNRQITVTSTWTTSTSSAVICTLAGAGGNV